MWANPKCRYVRLFANGCRMTYNIARVTGTFNYIWDILGTRESTDLLLE